MPEKIVILGAGESGIGSAILAQQKGFAVFVSDNGKIKEKYKEVLIHHSIEFEENGHSFDAFSDASLVIKSPGIPEKTEVIQFFRNNKVPVVSEIEFAAQYTRAKIIGITGSNGKTTTTMLTWEIFRNAGLKVGLAGNIGNSFALQVASEDFDFYIIELSSFQLDDIENFKPDVAVILNITPDHLDRYEYELQNYVDSKFRITKNMDENCTLIYCSDDEIVRNEIQKRQLKTQLVPFSLTQNYDIGAYKDKDRFIINLLNGEFNMAIDDLSLEGNHNLYNSMASSINARLFDIRKEDIRESLANFKGVEHRLEFVMRVAGITFINDSKATNVNSAWYALESMKEPTVWIAGGKDKGNNYNELMDLVKQKVKAIVSLGVDNAPLEKAFDGVTDIFPAKSMQEAVQTAYYLAKKGENVLLSPACASFDLFDNYQDRGNQFKVAVSNL